MKLIHVKMERDDEILVFGKSKNSGLLWFFLTVVVAMGGCKNDVSGPAGGDFPVNQKFASELIGRGIPADIAQFFAAARMETKSLNDTTCVYLQTFPNGASREITLRVSPNRKYTPTAQEIASIAPGNVPIYAFQYSSSDQADNTSRIELNYYVAKAGLPKAGAKQSNTTTRAGSIASLQKGTSITAGDGGGIDYVEIGKTGADVGIGSLIDYAKENGIKTGPLGSLYALASALSSVTGALDLSKEIKAQLAELDALENCAANPTNPLTRTDPTYSAATVAKIQEARTELKITAAVRYINAMTETGTGLTPVTAVMSIGLKQAFLWSEQTLKDYSESTIMREARLAVVPCDGVWSGTTSVIVSNSAPVYKVKGQVTWVQNTQLSTHTVAVYNPEGTLTIEMLISGLTITPSTFALSHADGELRINTSTAPPTYSGTSSTQPWSVTWNTPVSSYPGLAGGAWFMGEGSTAPSGSAISGTKTVGDVTFTYSFTRR